MDTEFHMSNFLMTDDVLNIDNHQEEDCIDNIFDIHTSSASLEPVLYTPTVAVQNMNNYSILCDYEIPFDDAFQYNDDSEGWLNEDKTYVLSFNRYIDDIKKWEIETNKTLKSISTDILILKEQKKRESETIVEPEINNIEESKESTIDATKSYDQDMVIIGPNGTKISRRFLNTIDRNMADTLIARRIVLEIFGSKTLAFSTLTGKSTTVFSDVLHKIKLDPHKVADIIHFLTKKLKMDESAIRRIIAYKCCEESANFCIRTGRTMFGRNLEKIVEDIVIDFENESNTEMVIIGPNGTKISRDFHNRIDWKSSSTVITRKIVSEIFGRKTLAFSLLAGKPTPFNSDKLQKKDILDPLKIADITYFLQKNLNIDEKLIRRTISKKCFSEHKTYCDQKFEETENIKPDTNPHRDFGLVRKSANDELIIGPNGTTISRNVIKRIDWNLSKTAIIRRIILEVFGSKTLAASSLKGKSSKESKLDPLKVADIVLFLKKKLNMPENVIRSLISKKCTQERSRRNDADSE